MKTFDLYGSTSISPLQLRDLIEAALGITFAQRDSYFFGDYFLARDIDDEHASFKIKSNLPDDEGDLLKPEFPDHTDLLYIDDTKRADEIRSVLSAFPDVTFLQREYV